MTCPALGSIVLCQFLQLSPNDCKVIYVRLAMNSVGHTKIQIYNTVFKSFLTHVYIFKSRIQKVRDVLVQRFITKSTSSTPRIYKMFILAPNIVRLKACVPYLNFDVLVLIFTLFQDPYTCQKGGSDHYVSLFTLKSHVNY